MEKLAVASETLASVRRRVTSGPTILDAVGRGVNLTTMLEYKCVAVGPPGGILPKVTAIADRITEVMNEHARDGWRFQDIQTTDNFSLSMIVFEREQPLSSV